MRPPRLPPALGSTITWIGWTVSGVAGILAALALVHKTGTTAVTTGAAAMVIAAQVGGSASKTLPETIAAISDLLTARTRARADARVSVMTAETRASIARAALDDPSLAPQVEAMLRELPGHFDYPSDRRPTDDTVLRLHAGHRTRSTSSEPSSGPDRPRPSQPTGSKVVPIRPEP